MDKLNEGSVVLCTVEKIVGTTVFLKIENNGEGTMVTSEVAAGRIRNLRDYVVPNKKIVCKVLKIDPEGNIHLSLRRVLSKEKKEVIEKYEKERNLLGVIKSVLKEKAGEVWEKIKNAEADILVFFQEGKEDLKILERYFKKEEAEKISKILKEKKEKEVEVKKEFRLTSSKPDGVEIIKKILLPHKEHITYISAGKFSLKIKEKDYKKANTKISEILQEIEKKAKEEKASFEAKEK